MQILEFLLKFEFFRKLSGLERIFGFFLELVDSL